MTLALVMAVQQPEPVVSASSMPVDRPLPAQSAQNVPPAESSPASVPGTVRTEEGVELTGEMKAQIQRISDAYEEQIRYPSFSQPIDPEELETKYLPNVAVATDIPARLDDANSPVLSLLPDKFRYFAGDTLIVSAQIQGLSSDAHSGIHASLTEGGKTLATAVVLSGDSGDHTYLLDFGTLDLQDVNWKAELQINAEFEFEGESFQRTITVEYVSTMARIEQAGPSRVVGEYLEIPVYVSTTKPGFHRLKGNLYDAASNKPLIHLTAEDNLRTANGTLVLRAHIAALLAGGSEGPYELRDLALTRMPSSPDYITEYGFAEQERIPVDGHRFDRYDHVPYQNEKNQRIAQELKRLGT